MRAAAFIERVRGRLIVSCQPVVGGPLDTTDFVVAVARAALDGGAAGLRIEGADAIAAVRAVTDAPIVGLIKRDRADSPVRITATASDVQAVADAGADVVAFDATRRTRPEPVAALRDAACASDLGAFADCADVEDAQDALAAGCDMIGTTLSGYTGGPQRERPDLALIAALAKLTPHVIGEGNIRTPDQAAAAMAAGAVSVVVGSAITRPEYVTSWFVEAITAVDAAPAARTRAAGP